MAAPSDDARAQALFSVSSVVLRSLRVTDLTFAPERQSAQKDDTIRTGVRRIWTPPPFRKAAPQRIFHP